MHNDRVGQFQDSYFFTFKQNSLWASSHFVASTCSYSGQVSAWDAAHESGVIWNKGWTRICTARCSGWRDAWMQPGCGMRVWRHFSMDCAPFWKEKKKITDNFRLDRSGPESSHWLWMLSISPSKPHWLIRYWKPCIARAATWSNGG